MKAWIAVLALAACHGGGSSDACLDAYHTMTRLSAFGGEGYGADGAFTTGLACKQLMNTDLDCVAKAKGRDDLGKCKHASEVIAAKDRLVHASPSDDSKPADPAAVIAVSQAACACADLGCLVTVAEQHATEIEGILSSGRPTDPAAKDAAQKLGDCVGKLR